jgi:hypothetical protein
MVGDTNAYAEVHETDVKMGCCRSYSNVLRGNVAMDMVGRVVLL